MSDPLVPYSKEWRLKNFGPSTVGEAIIGDKVFDNLMKQTLDKSRELMDSAITKALGGINEGRQ